MNDDERWGLPDGWAWTKISEVYEVKGGGTPSTKVSSYWEGDIPWITSADIHGIRDIRPRKRITQEAIKNSATKLVPEGSLIVVTRVGLGKLALANTQLCFSQDSQALIGAPSVIFPLYALYYLSQAVQQFKHKSRGTTISGVTKKQLLAIPLPLAPLAEQHRIVNAIEALFTQLDAGVAVLEQTQRLLSRYKASVLKAACEGQLVPQDPNDESASDLLERILIERRAAWEAEELAKMRGKEPKNDKWKAKYKEPAEPDTSELTELPAGWCWASFDQVGTVRLGRQRSPRNRSKDYPTKYLRAANITENGLDLFDVLDMEFKPHEKEVYRLRKGDLVISEASGSINQVGKVAIWNNEIDECCFQNTVIRLRPLNVNNFYLLLICHHYYVNGIFSKVATGVGINHLSANRFAKLPVPLPPLAEQQRVVSEVERRLSIIAEAEAIIEANLKWAARLRQSILKRAFEGKLVPQDPNDEPASALLAQIKAERAQG